MVTPNTLDAVISNIQNFSGKSKKLSETLNQSAEMLDTGTASTAVSQISELISQQSNMSVGELKRTRKDLSSFKGAINASDKITDKDRGNIISLLENQDKVLSESTTLSKKAAEFVQTKIKDNSIDMTAVVSGALAESPALAMGAMFVGNKIKEAIQARRERKTEQAERMERIRQQEEIQEEEMTALRGVITNQETLEKMNMSQEEATQLAIDTGKDYQEYVDELKNKLIIESKIAKQNQETAEEHEKAINSLRDKFGITAAETSPNIPSGGMDNVSSNTEESFDKIEEGLHEGTPYLKSILELMKFMSEENPDDIEERREKRRMDEKMLAAMKAKSNVSSVSESKSGNEGSMLDTIGDIGGVVGLGGGALGIAGLMKNKIKSMFGFGPKSVNTNSRIKPKVSNPGFFSRVLKSGSNIKGGGILGKGLALTSGLGLMAADKMSSIRNSVPTVMTTPPKTLTAPTSNLSNAPTVGRDPRTGRFTKLPQAIETPTNIPKVPNVATTPKVGMFRKGAGMLARGASRAVAPIAVGLTMFEALKILRDDTMSKEDKITEGAGLVGGTGAAAAGVTAGAMIGAIGGPIGMAIGGLLGGALGYFGGDKLGRATAGMITKPSSVETNDEGKIITKKIEPVVGNNIPENVPPRPEKSGRLSPAGATKLKQKQNEWDAMYSLSYDKNGEMLSQVRQRIMAQSANISDIKSDMNKQINRKGRANAILKENALNSETKPSESTGASANIVNAPSISNSRSTNAIVLQNIRNQNSTIQNSTNLLKGAW
jgi:hypothetical protein